MVRVSRLRGSRSGSNRIAGAPLRYYDLASLPASTLVLSGINDSEAFDPKETTPAAIDHLALAGTSVPPASRFRPACRRLARNVGTPGLPLQGADRRRRLPARRYEGNRLRPETLCVAGSIPNRTEVFVRLIGPRGNGFLWAQLVRFTVAPVELWIDGFRPRPCRYYKLDKLPSSTTELPGATIRGLRT